MAKRKRLTLPGQVEGAYEAGESLAGLQDPPALFAAPLGMMGGAPPIARVAADQAAQAALSDLAHEMAQARESGRMILSLPLDVVDEAYLVRDRVHADPEEMEALMASMRQRGQQMPIEVTALADGRYGLISGWRRLTALRRLSKTEPQLQRVLAILRRPDTAATAYLAMVEENELRVGLSYYERARIVLRTVEQGVFPDTATALARLFAPASKAKRSKIGSFFRIVQALDGVLRFPAHIPERLGLVLSRSLDQDSGLGVAITDSLAADPALQPQTELARLEALLAPAKPAKAPPVSSPVLPPNGTEELPGLFVETGFGYMTFRGPKLTADVQMQIIRLLRQVRE
ncbi:ParB N-terminal domain-containing protein [Rhodobacter sp. KR11]|uniref:ParB/RepB/Spo0J family partition protein n=1 Tax=Rhodobacter sp. KR11 TaxID=2974588 RepID=UPI00222386D0|nr:ParB N-terminal domain-containing protein [Rhodobacter sp. KR11]MCW1920784.1 ParB N-terminal domain-containing protein [Rhodobacter sp. KR11]